MESKLKELEERIARLEGMVFKTKNIAVRKSVCGPSGGIAQLIENGFLDKPKSVADVKKELEQQGYFYRLQSIDNSVRRDYMRGKGILTRIKQDGLWKYVVRK